MAVITGFNGVVLSGATPVAEIRSWEYTRGGEEQDTSVMGTTRTSLVNIKVTGTITVYANQFPGTDPAQDAGQATLTVGSSVTLSLHPNGTGSGKPELTGTALITEEVASAEQDGQVEGTFNFEVTGADDWTRNTQV